MGNPEYKHIEPSMVESPEELIRFFEARFEKMLDVMKRKNSDYTSGSDVDPFRNFRRHGELGIIVRMGDKLARLESFLAKDGNMRVADESFDDTGMDLANYALLLLAYRRRKREIKS